MENTITQWEQRFRRIGEQSVAGLPIYNPALQVEAIGFQPWQECWIGVLITPWFMNLMLIPSDRTQWGKLALGDKLKRKFPGGEQDLTVGEDDTLGLYLFRSLASPMLRFKSQEATHAVARKAIQQAMTEITDAEFPTSVETGSLADSRVDNSGTSSPGSTCEY